MGSKKLSVNIINNLKNNKTLYHFDNVSYNIGDNITKYNDLYNIVKNTYKKYINLESDKLIYMLDTIKDEYFEVFSYCYLVEADSPLEVYMDYSPIMCCINLKDIFKEVDETSPQVIEFVDLFARSYKGESKAKIILNSKYNNIISNKKEYITDKPVKVLDVYIDKGDK